MPVYVSPGVYIREIDLSLYAPQISTSILGNLGTATKGPVNEAIYISSHTQFIREFGNPSSDHLATLAHLQFMSKGNQSYFVRITDGSETKAKAEIPAEEGPALITGANEGSFTLSAATYGTIEGEEAQTYSITESTTFKCIGGTSSGNLAAFQLVSDGEFRMVYTDRAGSSSNIDITGLDFTSDLDLNDVAATIQAGIRAATSRNENFTYVGGNHFSFESDVNETGSNVNATFTSVPGGTGTDVHGASYMVMATVTPTAGSDGNDVIILAVDGGADQEVRFRDTNTTAQHMCDDINAGTTGITAWPETIGANTYVYVRTNTIGSSGEIEFKTVPSTIEGYTDVFGSGISIPASEVGTDGDVALTVWVNPFGYYRSGDSTANLSNFQAISNGSIQVNLDGAGALEASSMDFTSAADMSDVAQVMESAINGLAWPGNQNIKVEWSNGYFYFISNDETTPTLGTSSTIAVAAGTVGTNVFQAGYVEAGPGAVAGSASQSFTLTSGTVTTDAVIADLSGLTGATASNYKNYVRITTTLEGPAASLLVDAASTADTPLGLDNSVHWGTGTEQATFTLIAQTPGTDGNNLSAIVDEGYQKTQHDQWVTDNPAEPVEDSPYYEFRDAFKIDLYYSGTRVASFDNLTVNDTDADSFIETQLGTEASDYNPSKYMVAEDGGIGLPPAYGTYAFGATVALQGSNGTGALSEADYIGVAADPSGDPTGLHIYANAETLDVNLVIVPGVSATAVHTYMISMCENRADCMCILDPPFGLTGPQSVVDWSNRQGSYSPGQAINSSYAAIYWPWVKVYDSYNAVEVWTPPSGHVAAVYAYTDYVSEPWYAPAGYNRAHIIAAIDLEMSPNQGDRDLMYGYPNVVNPIVNFYPDGITIWGQRTAQRAPTALDRVNVRRLLLYARKIVATVVKYLVFEPNDPVTWRRFVNLVTPIFTNIQNRRGVYEFRVICDESTNPPDQIDRNEMNGRIYLKPTKAAEIITVDFVILSTGASFEELEY